MAIRPLKEWRPAPQACSQPSTDWTLGTIKYKHRVWFIATLPRLGRLSSYPEFGISTIWNYRTLGTKSMPLISIPYPVILNGGHWTFARGTETLLHTLTWVLRVLSFCSCFSKDSLTALMFCSKSLALVSSVWTKKMSTFLHQTKTCHFQWELGYQKGKANKSKWLLLFE